MSGLSRSPNEKEQGGAGWHDQYGNGLEPWIVEKTGPRVESFEDETIFWLDFTELLKSLPEMQRLAIEKSINGITLTNVERVYLHRARPAVAEWLETTAKLRGTTPG